MHQLVVPARQQLPADVLTQHVVHRRLDLHVQPRLDRQDPAPVLDREIGARGSELPDAVVGENEHQDDEGFPYEGRAFGANRSHVDARASSAAVKMSLASGHCRAACRCTNHSLPRISRNSGGGSRSKNAIVRSMSSALA